MAEHMPSPYGPEGGQVADPSALTTAALLREIASLDKIFTERLNALITRVDAMDKAFTLFHEDLVRVPTSVDKAVGQLKELHEKWFQEKFDSVAKQFHDRDERGRQNVIDMKVAIDTALAAQEKMASKQNESNAIASAKTEEGFSKQIEEQRRLLETTVRALNEKIDDLKELVLRGEGRGSGIAASWGVIVAVAGIALALAAFLLRK